ncbi:MAG: cytochrome c [Alphaproteobacteria bacterium]|nr:cytochrome c [Alphaproteobacteria bacterium]
MTSIVALLLTAIPTLAADPSAGRGLAFKWCAECHVVANNKVSTDGTPSFAAMAKDYADRPEALKVFLAQPHEPMPPLELSIRQIDDLAAFILAPSLPAK